MLILDRGRTKTGTRMMMMVIEIGLMCEKIPYDLYSYRTLKYRKRKRRLERSRETRIDGNGERQNYHYQRWWSLFAVVVVAVADSEKKQ